MANSNTRNEYDVAEMIGLENYLLLAILDAEAAIQIDQLVRSGQYSFQFIPTAS